jgi:hypothetical protein
MVVDAMKMGMEIGNWKWKRKPWRGFSGDAAIGGGQAGDGRTIGRWRGRWEPCV